MFEATTATAGGGYAREGEGEGEVKAEGGGMNRWEGRKGQEGEPDR